MAIRSENEIYAVLERALRPAKQPLTCVELMEIPDVRRAAIDEFGHDIQVATNKLSDTLGFMWRRDVLNRHLATPDKGRARYAYSWRETAPVTSPSPLPPAPAASKRRKPVFTITESDSDVTIEFEDVVLIVRRK